MGFKLQKYHFVFQQASLTVKISDAMDVHIVWEPKEALVDEIIHIKITHLNPWQKVTVCCKVQDKKQIFGSYAHYTASKEGVVDLTVDNAATSGMYSGVEPMGLFWSMVSAPGQRSGERLIKSDARTPFEFDISVYRDHITWDCMWNDHVQPIAQEKLVRWYMAPNVRRIEIEEGQIRGTLFLPSVLSSNEKRPGVIDMFGGRGGLVEMRAALLASHGFVALALAYFKYKDTPKEGSCLNYEYFEEAIKWLSAHPSVIPGGVGLIGVSLGAQIGLYMATHCPLLRAVVAINYPPIFGYNVQFKHGDHLIPCKNINEFKAFVTNTFGYNMVQWESTLSESSYFQFETENTPKILFIIGEEDPCALVNEYEKWIGMLPPERAVNVEMVVYPGAGHLIEPPHSPLCIACFTKSINMPLYYGGNTKSHAVAQELSWKKIQQFLWLNLPSSLISHL